MRIVSSRAKPPFLFNLGLMIFMCLFSVVTMRPVGTVFVSMRLAMMDPRANPGNVLHLGRGRRINAIAASQWTVPANGTSQQMTTRQPALSGGTDRAQPKGQLIQRQPG